MTKFLAIDYGLSRTGLSISDPEKIFAFPMETVETNQLINRLTDLIQSENISRIIIGKPKRFSGQDSEIESQIKTILTLFVEKIEIRGISRVDFLLHSENLYLNEVNTIPGSHALYLWQNIGKSKFELLNDMIEEAKNSVTHWSTEGSDGVALKSAKDIQSKLG